MEARKTIVAFLMMFVLTSGFAQENSKKAMRERSKIEKQHQIDSLINAREFVFVANQALPQGGGAVNLTGNTNSIKFHPEKIVSDMPFFGRAYSVDYGGGGGIKFEGKPKEYNVISRKDGKGYDINATIPVTGENYQLHLFVNPNGSASLSIISNQRSPISYEGSINKFEIPKGK